MNCKKSGQKYNFLVFSKILAISINLVFAFSSTKKFHPDD